MALFEEQITDTLTTDAPSIKYEGDQGPQSPQDERMAQLKNEYMQYVFEQKDLGEPIMSFEEWYQAVYEASKMGVDAGRQPQPMMRQPQPMMRQPVAYGGIMGLGGRRRYGFGSRLRKLIPNEVARVAEVAAPIAAMVAPQFALPAALIGGLGTYDRTGKLGSALKSGAMTYAAGQLSPGMERFKNVGGTNIWNTRSPLHDMYNLGSGTKTQGIRNLNPFKKGPPTNVYRPGQTIEKGGAPFTSFLEKAQRAGDETVPGGIMKQIDKFAVPILLGSMGLAAATAKPQDMKAAMSRGKGLELDSIREEVRVALADPSGEKWIELQKKYPYMGERSTKRAAEGGIMRLAYDNGGDVDTPWWKFWGGAADPEQPTEDTTMVGETLTKINQRALMTARAAQEAGIPLNDAQKQIIRQAEEQGLAYGGRARYYAGGQSIPSDYTVEDAMMTTTQDKLGGITDVMKQADLFRQGSVGQFYAARGGRIGYDNGGLSSLDFVDKIYSDEARALAGNIPEIRKHGSQYAPTLFEERTDTGEWKYPGEPREGQEYLTSTLQGANTILDKMEMKKQRLKELAKEKGLDFDDIFKMELDRIYDIEGPATKDLTKIKDRERILDDMEFKLTENLYAQGGRIRAQEGGLMDLGGMEKDYRNDGGFVPLGEEEKADDVPARLSKNEFVFTADAVRGAGGGDIDKGAEIMENIMKNLEQGGRISEETQGLGGAQEMFDVSERLSEVV